MKTVIRAWAAILLALSLSASGIAQQANPSSSRFMPKTQDQDRGKNERHPHIRGAIRELQEARQELQTAAHDFGGHRVDALRSVDEAIRQLQLALQYDKK